MTNATNQSSTADTAPSAAMIEYLVEASRQAAEAAANAAEAAANAAEASAKAAEDAAMYAAGAEAAEALLMSLLPS